MSPSAALIPPWTESSDEANVRLDAMTVCLAAADGPADEAGVWPQALWEVLLAARAPGWSLPEALGGEECDRPTLAER
ncbi:MAG: hypothetical protein P4L84_23605 [Isosphaeraceae bacterium]|nr:hypothetical protein [Isosphaeraceae bacterium]